MTRQAAFNSIRSYLLRQMVLAQARRLSPDMRRILWKRASVMAAETVMADRTGFPVSIPVQR